MGYDMGIAILVWCSIVILLLPLTIMVIRVFTGIRVRIPGTLAVDTHHPEAADIEYPHLQSIACPSQGTEHGWEY